MPVLLQLLAQSNERLYIAPAADNEDGDVEAERKGELGEGDCVAAAELCMLLGGFLRDEFEQRFGEVRVDVDVDAAVIYRSAD